MSRRRSKGRSVNGVLLLDKPVGMSSNLALQIVKRLFNASKAGHTGSLDPLASGLLPICAWCKKIRNDEGYWTDVSTYISERTNADFSHGICPDCYKKVKAEEMDLQ